MEDTDVSHVICCVHDALGHPAPAPHAASAI
jgi:hypothetical protein